jgi:hypothetical protein
MRTVEARKPTRASARNSNASTATEEEQAPPREDEPEQPKLEEPSDMAARMTRGADHAPSRGTSSRPVVPSARGSSRNGGRPRARGGRGLTASAFVAVPDLRNLRRTTMEDLQTKIVNVDFESIRPAETVNMRNSKGKGKMEEVAEETPKDGDQDGAEAEWTDDGREMDWGAAAYEELKKGMPTKAPSVRTMDEVPAMMEEYSSD